MFTLDDLAKQGLGDEAVAVLAVTQRKARELAQEVVTVPHILYALLIDAHGIPAQIVRACGTNPHDILQVVETF